MMRLVLKTSRPDVEFYSIDKLFMCNMLIQVCELVKKKNALFSEPVIQNL